MEKDGLYIRLGKDGKLARTLISHGEKKKFKNTTVCDELILFSELNFGPYTEVLKTLGEIGIELCKDLEHSTEVDMDIYMSFYNLAYNLCDALEEEYPIQGTLTRTMLDDNIPIDNGEETFYKETINIIFQTINSVYGCYCCLHSYMHKICKGLQVDIEKDYPEFTELTVPTVFAYNGKGFVGEYYFRSISDYYTFIIQRFINLKYKFLYCQCCGRYFIPTSGNNKSYCNRIIKDGKTCKELGPRYKKMAEAKKDPVANVYSQTEAKMKRRCDRNPDEYPILVEWRVKAKEAVRKYQDGELAADEAIALIQTENRQRYNLNADK